MTKDWYKNKRWLKLREQVLRRDNYIDQLEKRYGRIKPAELVHHIFPREQYPEYEYEAWNLISISKQTHNRLHNRTTDELTKEGMALQERIARKYSIKIQK